MRQVKRLVVALAFAALAACGSEDSNALNGQSAPAGGDPAGGIDPLGKDNATEKAGLEAATKRKCGDCHDGPKGKMSGRPTSLGKDASVELYPPNLTPDKDTGIGGWSDDQLANAMRTGLDRQGLQLCSQMKHDAQMSDFEAYSIVKYLRTLPAVSNKVLRSVCPPLKTKEEQAQAQ